MFRNCWNAWKNEIIKKVKEDFERWKTQYQIRDVPSNPTSLKQEIKNIEAKIDSLVFALYGLDNNEIRTVMSHLHLPLSFQERVLSYFDEIDKLVG